MRRSAVVLAIAIAAAAGCSKRSPPPPTAAAAWRDQYIFIADDGTVVPLVLWRSAAGNAEAKGWLGRDGRWQQRFYHRYTLTAKAAASPNASLRALSQSPGTPVHGRIESTGAGLSIELRMRSSAMTLTAGALAELGDARDPEGRLVYRAGRATLTTGGRALEGWLLVEHTPASAPLAPFVDYGDFLLAFAATRDRTLVVRQSRTVPGFDRAFERTADGASRTLTAARADRAGDHLTLRDGDTTIATMPIRDVSTSTGMAPDHRPVRYEVLLLGGGGWYGVAFAIRPAPAP